MAAPESNLPVTTATERHPGVGPGTDDCSLTWASDPAVVPTVAPPLKRNVLAGHKAMADSRVPTAGSGTDWTSDPDADQRDHEGSDDEAPQESSLSINYIPDGHPASGYWLRRVEIVGHPSAPRQIPVPAVPMDHVEVAVYTDRVAAQDDPAAAGAQAVGR
jgi:hypothetical protein